MNADINEETFALINLCNANTETDKIKTNSGVDQLLCHFYLDSNQKIILTGDFNLFFDLCLVASAVKPTFKKSRF